MKHLISFLIATLLLTGCGSMRDPVPPGTIPTQQTVSVSDEQYGHQVLNELNKKYPLDTNDNRINRVRDIIDRLADGTTGSGDPWHVYVLRDDTVKNAAATRGNYIFVWTGMIHTVQDDTELATILSHEMGHVLAGHTEPTPQEQVSQILSGVSGAAINQVLIHNGVVGAAARLAGSLVQELMKGALVNPGSQEAELEADHIGLFLMADTGYDPEKAVQFWDRVKDDASFGRTSLQFFSSHPSSALRLKKLEEYLPEAKIRYRDRKK